MKDRQRLMDQHAEGIAWAHRMLDVIALLEKTTRAPNVVERMADREAARAAGVSTGAVRLCACDCGRALPADAYAKQLVRTECRPAYKSRLTAQRYHRKKELEPAA